MSVLPPNSILLVPHDHFGIDLAPGLSIKLNSAFVSDVLGDRWRSKATLSSWFARNSAGKSALTFAAIFPRGR